MDLGIDQLLKTIYVTITDSLLAKEKSHVPVAGFQYLSSEQRVIRRLRSSDGRLCSQSHTNDDFEMDFCQINCITNEKYRLLGCVPIDGDTPVIIRNNNYSKPRLCSDNNLMPNITISHRVRSKCQKSCPPKCQTIFNNVYERKKFKYNDKRVIIFEIRSQVTYIERYRMDIWELIYQLGGVVGVWFGWSALSISFLKNHLKPLQYKYLRFKN